jgi:hypothetical protein
MRRAMREEKRMRVKEGEEAGASIALKREIERGAAREAGESAGGAPGCDAGEGIDWRRKGELTGGPGLAARGERKGRWEWAGGALWAKRGGVGPHGPKR